jgi:hypothetical protein
MYSDYPLDSPRWEEAMAWIVAGATSIIICIIGMRTAEFGFLPGNLFCIGLYANNLRHWRLNAQIAKSQSGPLSNS